MSRGAFGFVSIGDSSGGNPIFGFLSVNRAGGTDTSGTFLFYSIVTCGPFFCFEVASGAGPIASADVTGTGRSELRLDTNTSGNPDFVVFVGPRGRITVEWQSTNLFSFRQNSTSETVSPSFRSRQTGQSTSSSATAAGNVVGFSFGTGFGQIGGSQLVTIDIFH